MSDKIEIGQIQCKSVSNIAYRWISANDKLPKKSNNIRTVTVLLWVTGQSESPYILGYGVMEDGVNYPFKIEEWKSAETGYSINFGEVTHWMPLPEPPEDM